MVDGESWPSNSFIMFELAVALVLLRLGYRDARSPNGFGLEIAPGTKPYAPWPECGVGLLVEYVLVDGLYPPPEVENPIGIIF
jgi:hypothetical protein